MSAVTIRLISDDVGLYTICREIMAAQDRGEWRIATGLPASGSDDDLYIWDYCEDFVFPESINHSRSKHLFLVDRKLVARVRERVPFSEGSILLKPVTRPTLTAFLGLAVSAHAARVSSAEGLRAVSDQMLQCVIQANLRLQEYDQDRTNFLTRAVHDFRAPLTAITGYCGLLLESALGPLNEDQKEALRRMRQSSQRLSKLAVAMYELNIGRYRPSDSELQLGDLREPLDQAIHEISPFAAEKQIEITADLAALDGQQIHFQHEHMVQVLVNLLENACKFTPKAGYIEIRGYSYFWERRHCGALFANVDRRIRTERQPNAYRLDVHDSGTPINPELLEEIFEEYTTFSCNGDRSGGGLGLAICRMILTQHHGRVWAGNREGGPVFSVVLPTHRHVEPDGDTILSAHSKSELNHKNNHVAIN